MRILPVNNYQNRTNRSNQPNFEAKMFRIVRANGDEISISGELLGRVIKKLWNDPEASKIASWNISLLEAGNNTPIYEAVSIPKNLKPLADTFYSDLARKVGEARHTSGDGEVIFDERLKIPKEYLK